MKRQLHLGDTEYLPHPGKSKTEKVRIVISLSVGTTRTKEGMLAEAHKIVERLRPMQLGAISIRSDSPTGTWVFAKNKDEFDVIIRARAAHRATLRKGPKK